MSPEVFTYVGIALFVGLTVLWYYLRNRDAVPDAILELIPDQIEYYIEQAVQYAALFVERVDEQGHLGQFFDEIKNKSEQKLELAVDVAVERLETYINELFVQKGIDVVIDIPESFIKDVIQRYVWQNPDLFPSKSKELTNEASNSPQD